MLIILLVDNDISSKSMMEPMLKELGHEIYVVSTIQEIESIIRTTKIDLIISKIKLTDGNAIMYFGNLKLKLPTILMTKVANKSFIDEVAKIPYATFFIETTNTNTLSTAIETAFWLFVNKFTNKSNSIPISISYGKIAEIPIAAILWVTVSGNYTTIKTAQRRFIQKTSFKKIRSFLDDRFVQIDKSCVINSLFVKSYNKKTHVVNIQNKEFSISRTYRSALKNKLFDNGIV